MNTTEGLLAAGGGAVAGVLLGSLVLSSASMDTPLWGSGDRDRDALLRLRDRLKQEGIPARFVTLSGNRMSGIGLGQKGETLNLLLIRENQADFDKAFAIASQIMTPEVR